MRTRISQAFLRTVVIGWRQDFKVKVIHIFVDFLLSLNISWRASLFILLLEVQNASLDSVNLCWGIKAQTQEGKDLAHSFHLDLFYLVELNK